MARFVFVHPHLIKPGGSSTYVLRLVEGLENLGHDCTIVTQRAHQTLKDRFSIIELGGPLPSSVLFWLTIPLLLLRVRRVLISLPGEIVASVFPSNWLLLALAPSLSRSVSGIIYEPTHFVHSELWSHSISHPLIGPLVRLFRPQLRRFDIWLHRNLTRAIVISDYTRRQAQLAYPGPRLHLVPSGPDPSIGPGSRTGRSLVCAGVLVPFKRIDLLLRAFAASSGYDKIVIIGEGSQRIELEILAASLGIDDRAIFCGFIPAPLLRRYYREAAVVVVATDEEPFGLTALEGLASGTPVVCSLTGGTREMVDEGVNGEMFRAGDQVSLTSALERALQITTPPESIAAEIRTRYSWERSAELFIEAFAA